MKAADYERIKVCSRDVPMEAKHLEINRIIEVENHYRKMWLRTKTDFHDGNIKAKRKMEFYMDLREFLTELWWGKNATIAKQAQREAEKAYWEEIRLQKLV